MTADNYQPNFSLPCRECGTVPTVHVVEHIQPETELCGIHFFQDRSMRDWTNWNDQKEATE